MSGAIGAGLSMLGGVIGAYDQHRRQKKLMGIQYENQRLLNQQGHDLQMDMWNKTNYGAQVKHMKEAGLNPALMYGSAGQGGTTGSQGGGSAASGNAAALQAMDLSNMMLMKAQTKDLEANARLKNVEADKKEGIDTEFLRSQMKKIESEFKNINADTIKKIQETTNLKTVDEWNKVRKGLDELRESKKVTGSSVVDLMTQLGLDPVNNSDDQDAVRVLLGLFYGSSMVKNVMQGIGSMKGGKTQIGEIFNNTNIHK